MLDNQVLDNAPTDMQNNLVLGVAQYKTLRATGKNYQSEASVANVNIFSAPQTVSTMIDLTTHNSCTNGDFLSWSEASWNMV